MTAESSPSREFDYGSPPSVYGYERGYGDPPPYDYPPHDDAPYGYQRYGYPPFEPPDYGAPPPVPYFPSPAEPREDEDEDNPRRKFLDHIARVTTPPETPEPEPPEATPSGRHRLRDHPSNPITEVPGDLFEAEEPTRPTTQPPPPPARRPIARGPQRAISWASRILPPADRERYFDEYLSELDELAQSAHPHRAQLMYAFRLLVRIPALRIALRAKAPERTR
ncbi:hypothetical protein [Amycolatopsis sp. NPDC059021]|uniref:hypothetical protein n=1 Tax=Amycolatopsis sp. NPDC059021 TaxID=3346704 RepID=UPI00366D1BA4